MENVPIFSKIEVWVRGFLSHRPILYAAVAGAGIILFWRGIWHTVDLVHLFLYQYAGGSTIDWNQTPWWDGPLSMLVGFLVLVFAGAFVSSFIGNEILLSGLRGEKKLSRRIETEERAEVSLIGEIRADLSNLSRKIDNLEAEVAQKNR